MTAPRRGRLSRAKPDSPSPSGGASGRGEAVRTVALTSLLALLTPTLPTPARAAELNLGGAAVLDKGLDAFGHARLGGIGEWLANEIETRTGKEARTTVLGHIQRGGTPTAFDRELATRFGLHAIDAATDDDWGKMVALSGTDIVRVPLKDATSELKLVTPELYAEAEVFFG